MYFCLVKFVKTASISLLILFTFIGNLGIKVFTHSCEEDGVFRSFIIKTTDHCDIQKEEVTHACCKPKQNVDCEFANEKSCCDDEVSVFKINLDYFSYYQLELSQLNWLEIPLKYNFTPDFIHQLKNQKEDLIHPPPLLSGKEILIKYQVFRI